MLLFIRAVSEEESGPQNLILLFCWAHDPTV